MDQNGYVSNPVTMTCELPVFESMYGAGDIQPYRSAGRELQLVSTVTVGPEDR